MCGVKLVIRPSTPFGTLNISPCVNTAKYDEAI
jgi:hypothetical protein